MVRMPREPKKKKSRGLTQADPGKSRKERRKEERKLKKRLKADRRGGKKDSEEGGVKVERKKEEKIVKVVNKEAKARKEREKRRKAALRQENLAEDQNIRKLSKKLGLKKERIPKSFKEDGLDFILDVLDSNKLGDNQELQEDSNIEDTDSLSDLIQSHDDEEESVDSHMDQEDSSTEEKKELYDSEEELDEMREGEEEEGGVCMEEEEEEEEIVHNEEGDLDNDKKESFNKSKEENWEDIYGRMRDPSGNVIHSSSAYVPPALRAHTGEDNNLKARLKKKMKGLLNRLAESNMRGISSEIESLYRENSRRNTNTALTELIAEATISYILTPERLVMEYAMLIAVLNINVGTEVGAHFLYWIVSKFDQEYSSANLSDSESKTLDCCLLLICHLYSFKVMDSLLIYDLLKKLIASFQSKDVELILLALRTVGFLLRKEDSASFKSSILEIQSRAQKSKIEDSRTKFMIEVLMAIKNNNVKKIPNYNPEHQNHSKKIMKSFLRPGVSSTPLSVGLKDLLCADEKGHWWIVGSAWSGHENSELKSIQPSNEQKYSAELLKLARKMRMNTDSRKALFCAVMSSEDYIDAYEKILKLKNIPHKERETTFVLQDCCLQEKKFNPYYVQVISKLASMDRKYRMSTQFGLWDKIKELENLTSIQSSNLADFTAELILNYTLSISVLKVITFADVDKSAVAFLKTVLIKILKKDEEAVRKVFEPVGGHVKLKDFRDSIILFMKCFLSQSKEQGLSQRILFAENILKSRENLTYL